MDLMNKFDLVSVVSCQSLLIVYTCHRIPLILLFDVLVSFPSSLHLHPWPSSDPSPLLYALRHTPHGLYFVSPIVIPGRSFYLHLPDVARYMSTTYHDLLLPKRPRIAYSIVSLSPGRLFRLLLDAVDAGLVTT